MDYLIDISVLCFNKADVTKQFLKLMLNTTGLERVRFVLTDNGSTDGTAEVLRNIKLPNKLIITHKSNIGFPAGHNHALTHASSEYFLALNNDLMIKDPDWIQKALAPFQAVGNVGLVGLDGTPCQLEPDGQGKVGPRRDYVEGSFVLGRTEDFRKYGLFSKAFRMYVYEDSDLSLRFRQMGFAIHHIKLNYKHQSHATLNTIDRTEKARNVKHNQAIFKDRWGKYLNHRRFFNRIRVHIPSVGIGDVLCATPAVAGLRADHPTAEIQVSTRFPEVFMNSPRNLTARPTFGREKIDREITLNPNYGETELLSTAYANAAHTVPGRKVPELWLRSDETVLGKALIQKDTATKRVVCSFFSGRKGWEGRSWSMKQAKAFFEHRHAHFPGAKFVEVGKGIPRTGRSDIDLVDQTTLRELFAVVSQADAVITVDSLVLHVAQAFGIPTVALFGATLPQSRIGNPSVCRVLHSGIGCLGCYQKKKKPGFNRCDRRDEVCMGAITSGMVTEALKEILK